MLSSMKALLRDGLKSSFNVDKLFNSSNMLVMFSYKLLLFVLKHGPCGLWLWKTVPLLTLLELLLIWTFLYEIFRYLRNSNFNVNKLSIILFFALIISSLRNSIWSIRYL